jgi:DNA-binding GntR family transcriptional regulator
VTEVGIDRLRDMRIDRLHSSAGGPASRQAYRALRDAIIATELEPGQRFSENELAERLAVSRTPIREALIRLRDDRFVQIVPQLGTFVTRISTSAVEDAQFIRESLECAAVRLAATRAQDAELADLAGLVRRQAEVVAHGDYERFAVLDDEFHAALCELAGRPVAWEVAQRVKGHLNRVRRLSLPQPQLPRRDGGRAPPRARCDGATIPTRRRRHCATTCGWCSRRCRRSACSTPTTSRTRSADDGDRDGHAARLYEQMLLIRVFETEAERQYKAARIGGYCHLSSGQEAATVGATHALDPATCSSPATAVTASRSRAVSRSRR